MSSLTETAYYTRRAINWTILGVVGYIILRLFWGIFVLLWIAIFPPKAPPPNHAFGRLPALKFPVQSTPSAQLVFELQSIDGTIPVASASAPVYFMPKSAPNLLGLNKTQEFAQTFNFDPAPIQESKNIYRFNDPENPLRRLRYDIVSKNFIIRYAFERDASLFIDKNFSSEAALKLEALNILTSSDLDAADLDVDNPTVSYLKLIGEQLTQTTSLSQSDAVRIDIFRLPVGNTRVVTPVPGEAPISIIFSGSTLGNRRMIQFAYTYWPIDYFTSATYALKSTETAWAELQQGKGYIARYPTNGSTAVVRDVYLAYYDSFEPQTYLQPVFVFEGDDNFTAYVKAVTDEWSD